MKKHLRFLLVGLWASCLVASSALADSRPTISFTSKSGQVISNAKVMRTNDGVSLVWEKDGGASGGLVRLEDLPENLRAQFGYDPAKTKAADEQARQRRIQWLQPVAAFGGPQIGMPAPGFTAVDVGGKTVRLGDFKGKIVVLESYYNGCPFCENHYKGGAMQELQKELTTNGVVWLLINSIPPVLQQTAARQTMARAKQDWADKKMAITDWIIDSDYQIARAYAMRTAPEAFVINTNGILAYEGAVDNLPQMYSKNGFPALNLDPRTARNYVREAVRALLSGKTVPVPETKPYGCALIYPGMPDAQMFTPPNFRPR